MAATKDFRGYAFDPTRVDASGKDLGSKVYWRLYAIENLVRVITHSVMTAQLGTNWWTLAVDPKIQGGVQSRMKDYTSRPWHSTPGKHEIYYAYLSDMSKIIATNSHQFVPIIPDIDQWIARIEQVRLPRNIASHMNWLHSTDRSRIEVAHADLRELVLKLGSSGLNLQIP